MTIGTHRPKIVNRINNIFTVAFRQRSQVVNVNVTVRNITVGSAKVEAANMASCYMRKQWCEEQLKHYGMIVLDADKKEVTKMNPLAYYMQQLDADLMKYHRLFKQVQNSSSDKGEKPQNFMDMIKG